MRIQPIKTGIFKEGENLFAFITKNIKRLQNGSVLVVTSKIVALAEGRTAKLRDKKKFVRAESEWALQAKYGMLTFKDGLFLWNAGIDTSNANGKIILLPKDSFRSANSLRQKLRRHFKIKNLGIIITDSRIVPLRAGVVALALGYAGFKGIRDYRGKKDIFGDIYQVTRTDVADSLATAAVLLMGEGAERRPLAIIEGAPVEFCNRVSPKELLIPIKDDMYRPLFARKLKTGGKRKK